jgi:transforming growth factor-beta-induced protein
LQKISVLDFVAGTVVDYVVGNPELTALTAAVVRAGLVGALNSDAEFTLFAPNDEAFGAVDPNILDTLLNNDEFIPHLTDLLLYHVLDAEVFSAHIFNFQVDALNRETLLLSTDPVAINGNQVVDADNDVRNGVVHVIDGVLIPSWVSSSIANRVIGASDLSTLLSLVVLAGLDGAVAAARELTLVAPTNDAFAKLPAATVEFLLSDDGKATLTQILLYHVFPGIFVSSELSDGITVDTLQGGTVEVSVGNAGVFFNDAKAVEVDILANNGVVHKIDTVLNPADGENEGLPEEETIVDFVVGNPDLTSLTAAVVRAGLVDALNSGGPFTLFAPNDRAFGALPSEIVNTLLTNDEFIPHLTDLLLYHVLDAELRSAHIFNFRVTALNGEKLLLSTDPIGINGNVVVSADNLESNGVVHIIDGVLIPSWVSNSIAGRVVGDGDLSTLLALVVLAELDGAVAAAGELTLVAPTNAAFAKLPAATVEFVTSKKGKNTLVEILLYHVFPGIFVSSELSDGITVNTLQGGTVEVSVGNAGVFFNDAKAVEVDILANNGVVHKIDTVLNPADSN